MKKLPVFQSPEEAAEFVESHDMTELWDELERVEPMDVRARPRKDRQLNLRIDGESLNLLKQVAFRKQLGYHTLARMWIAEALALEAARLGLTSRGFVKPSNTVPKSSTSG